MEDLEFVAAVLRDVCTPEELADMAQRFRKMAMAQSAEASSTSSDGMSMIFTAGSHRWNRLAELVEPKESENAAAPSEAG